MERIILENHLVIMRVLLSMVQSGPNEKMLQEQIAFTEATLRALVD